MENSKYLNHLLNNDLSAKMMIRSLMILLKSECAIELSVKRLVDCLIKAGESLVYKDYEAFHALRYDFVDLTNRRIYEFDGEQHFDKENYFNGTYENYVDSLNRDLLKQRIAKHLKFDIVRVSGKLKVFDFIDILNRCHLKHGQSLFIRDTYFEIIDSSLLKESYEIDLLEEIANLKLDIQHLNDKIEELTEENCYLTETIEASDKRKVKEPNFKEFYKDVVDQFFIENIEHIQYHEVIPIYFLYYKFIEWTKNSEYNKMCKTDKYNIRKFKIQSFNSILRDLGNTYQFTLTMNRTTYKKYRYMNTLLAFFENQTKYLDQKQISISFHNYITDDDIESFKELNHPIGRLSNKQKQILNIIKHEQNHNTYEELYSSDLK